MKWIGLYAWSASACTMGANEVMTTTRIRKYDLERIKEISMPRESNWEVIQRIIDDYMSRRV